MYKKLNLDKIVNGCGKMTAIGASKVSVTVLEAMNEVGKNFVAIDDLLDKVGEEISKVTGGQDTCVTSSASAGIALSVAGLITGKNLAKSENLPTINVKKNKIIIQKGHSISYGVPISTMINLGRGEVIEVGQSNSTLREHVEEAIDENTLALFYVKSHHAVQKGMLSLENMIIISKKNNIPLIVDAAAEEDFKKYIKAGVDLVIYSGAKALCGPASGFVTGKKIYIDAIKLQYKGIGRTMKIDKMSIVGLGQAVKEYSSRNETEMKLTQFKLANLLIDKLKDNKKLEMKIIQDEAGRNIYRVQLKLTAKAAITGETMINKLQEGTPKIYVRKHYANLGILNIDFRALSVSDIDLIVKKIEKIL